MKRKLPESPLYRIFRETPSEELKEFFAPALRAAKEDQKAISARAKAIRAARETAATATSILQVVCPGLSADEISELLKPYLKKAWEDQQAIHTRVEEKPDPEPGPSA
ncbi:hypothetical protein EQ836_25375 [Ectopseudomonas mendocina]|uniref:Uncharacterized protein n=1 Tax=Ectopseudomonas mendocina TaxID=300 RepID=A0ABD7RP61_ECTME|nr:MULTISPECIES: hypothetical protein [Pseudomonas]TRO07551.1 hypothetical protein EQ829_25365 [Pseudomonas mendocina]TRO10700.1 hypothetical protein EQ836_25375 [Pseudomonas mendocina]